MLSVFCHRCSEWRGKDKREFHQTPLKSFISELELKYPVKFFYDDEYIDNIYISGVFEELPLKECLHSIFEKTQVNFYISGNNHVVIYQGFPLSDLFPRTNSEDGCQ